MAAHPNSMGDAAEHLEGLVLDGGWSVVEKILKDPAGTGGNFCVGYLVVNVDGRAGFCKALKMSTALLSPDPAAWSQKITSAYNFERALVEKCAARRMSRVVSGLTSGVVTVPGYAYPNINYMIFERAEGDIRKVLNVSASMDIAARLRALHHVTTGLSQLHQVQVAHQDMKPSNVLVFGDGTGMSPRVSKVADLGRACDPTRPIEHDGLPIAGDPVYAPPEQLYRATPVEFGPRRLACDLYQLGSITSFLFTGATVNGLLFRHLPLQHTWHLWGGTYAEALPYVRDAFGHALAEINDHLPYDFQHDVTRIVSYLCDPDPLRRGHPMALVHAHENQYDLKRTVTEFNLLARRAELGVKRSLV